MCCYFVLTTLSTVGYGDKYPISNFEKILGILLMIVGIAFFSYVMGNFNDVLTNYDNKMGNVNKRGDLQAWMNSLSKFNKKKVPRELIHKIDNHFHFFWANDRLCGLSPDDDYLMTMPFQLRMQLINFLFDDIFHMFRAFLHKNQFPNSKFYYELAFMFLPQEIPAGQVILEGHLKAKDIYLIVNGEVNASIVNEEGLELSRIYSKGTFFGDNALLNDKPNGFKVRAHVATKVYVLPIHEFRKILSGYQEIKD